MTTENIAELRTLIRTLTPMQERLLAMAIKAEIDATHAGAQLGTSSQAIASRKVSETWSALEESGHDRINKQGAHERVTPLTVTTADLRNIGDSAHQRECKLVIVSGAPCMEKILLRGILAITGHTIVATEDFPWQSEGSDAAATMDTAYVTDFPWLDYCKLDPNAS